MLRYDSQAVQKKDKSMCVHINFLTKLDKKNTQILWSNIICAVCFLSSGMGLSGVIMPEQWLLLITAGTYINFYLSQREFVRLLTVGFLEAGLLYTAGGYIKHTDLRYTNPDNGLWVSNVVCVQTGIQRLSRRGFCFKHKE